MKKVVFAMLFLTTPAVARQGNDDHRQPLYGNLGPHNRTITTSSHMAQAYFSEGLQFMYAFGPSSALLSFREAQRHDPNCAMCFWGEAWALSPYLNGRMRPAKEKEAYAAIHKAKDLSARHANDVEQALIEAFKSRYTDEPTAETRRPLDSLYSREIREVAESYPHDADIQTLYGESLMLLRPRRGSVDLADPSVKTILHILEGVLERDVKHPGACHLYIHLMEASLEPARAEACADYLGDAIPGASHIRHMPSHIYMKIGRYSDAVKANQNAWHVDQQAAYGGPPGIYPSHNLHAAVRSDPRRAECRRDSGREGSSQGFSQLGVLLSGLVGELWPAGRGAGVRPELRRSVPGGHVALCQGDGALENRRPRLGEDRIAGDTNHHRATPRVGTVSISLPICCAEYPRGHSRR